MQIDLSPIAAELDEYRIAVKALGAFGSGYHPAHLVIDAEGAVQGTSYALSAALLKLVDGPK